MSKLSVIINTFNEEKNLPRAIHSVKNLADEVIVVDTESEDATVKVAEKLGAKVYRHERVGYVEPVRNFAADKALYDWVLVLDADEEVPSSLVSEIKKVLKSPKADYYRIPRKNIIFGEWIANSRWWPDMNIRLFRKGFVVWSNEIHRIPVTKGIGADFPEEERFALIHHNYKDIDGYLDRMFRYSKVQAKELIEKGYEFEWTDLVKKPVGEFLSRYFAGQGYKDGLHGLVLAVLQGFSEFIVYVRTWGEKGYKPKDLDKKDVQKAFERSVFELKWWVRKEFSWLRNLLSR